MGVRGVCARAQKEEKEFVYERERERVCELILADGAAERRHAVRLLHSIRTRRV